MKSESPFPEPLLLASASPRRAEILRTVGWPFEQSASSIDETRADGENAVAYVERLAQAKAEAVGEQLISGLILGADTVVVIEGEILGQPRDDDDARRMLGKLQGKWHEVLTGVALVKVGRTVRAVAHETTRVRFGEMSNEEIEWYVATQEPRGKAGAYAVQGHASLFIEEIQGDYFNVVGLPIRLVYQLAQKI